MVRSRFLYSFAHHEAKSDAFLVYIFQPKAEETNAIIVKSKPGWHPYRIFFVMFRCGSSFRNYSDADSLV